MKYKKLIIILTLCILFVPINALAKTPKEIIYNEISSSIGTTHKAKWLTDAIMYSSSLYNVDPLLITAVMKQESNFNFKAISSDGAIGLMQLMPDTARGYGVNPYNPLSNILGGTAYLKDLLHNFKNYGKYSVTYALAGYNAGGYEVKNRGVRFNETKMYVKNIDIIYRRLLSQLSY